MKFTKIGSVLLLLMLLIPITDVLAQTGKIAGTVRDAETGEVLPGVNVVIDGTTQGAVTDLEGFYTILNIRPGTYALRVSFVGYAVQVINDVKVNTNLTSEVTVELQEQRVGLEEMVVTAARPIVQRDVSASIANISAEDIENLPATDVQRVVGLQAGFERGLVIRGEGGDQVQFQVDGQSMASGRDNAPFVGVSFTNVQEVQVQTGGFNAEYGNVRSGLVNIITKDPSRTRYTVDVIGRFSGASERTMGGVDIFGDEVNGYESRNGSGVFQSYHLRPLFDPDVAFVGTANGTWEDWMQAEYDSFDGWNNLATSYNETNGTNVSPQDLQQAHLDHYMRKSLEVDVPDYEFDGTITGPVPGLSKLLGDLRFVASYRQTQSAYAVPQERTSFDERTIQGKLISNIGQGMKLELNTLYATQDGINRSENGAPNLVVADLPAYPWTGGSTVINDVGDDPGEIYANIPYHLMDVDRFSIGAHFTHTLNQNTFYEVRLQSVGTDYFTRASGSTRSTDRTFSYANGAINLTEEPFGFTAIDFYGELGTGWRTAGHWGSGYDNSQVQRFSGRFDLTSQVNRYALFKAGVEYINTNYDVDFGEDDIAHPHNGDPKWRYDRTPQQAAAYAQTKLEFGGMVANLGLRMDYFHASGDWFTFTPFDRAFSAQFGIDQIDETLEQEATERQVSLSPRLGVSFPITENSKLYFNYGHFRNQLQPIFLFNLQENYTGAVIGIGNPNHDMPRTVAYELGYEQNLFDQYLLRLAGYYRDLSDQPRLVRYISVDDLVNYQTALPWNYADTRGFEITLQKNRGRLVRGFLNYTYMVRKTGNFGNSQFDENRTAQNNFLISTQEHYASKPIPEPFARFNIEFLLPTTLGPQVGDSHPLGDWRLSFLGEWRKGQAFTWNGNNLASSASISATRDLQGNVRWRDFYNLDMRISKNFDTRLGAAQLFVDFTNVLNLRHMYRNSLFVGNNDERNYMESLMLPLGTLPDDEEGTDLYGSDQPGDFRKPGVAYVPIIIGDLPESATSEHPLYYVPGEDQYYEWNNASGAFAPADEGRVDQVIDDKAYINMPNQTYFTFLNPRNVFFGIRLSF